MKNVLIIFGSPRKDGATSELLSACLHGLGEAEITEWNCFENPISPCDDCRFCQTECGCRHHDLDKFYRFLEDADVLIVASPVYNRGFPAPVKAVLDRLQPYWSARFIHGIKNYVKKPKQTILLTAGGSERADGEYLQSSLAPALTILNSSPAIHVHALGTDHSLLSADDLKAALDAGRSINEEK